MRGFAFFAKKTLFLSWKNQTWPPQLPQNVNPAFSVLMQHFPANFPFDIHFMPVYRRLSPKIGFGKKLRTKLRLSWEKLRKNWDSQFKLRHHVSRSERLLLGTWIVADLGSQFAIYQPLTSKNTKIKNSSRRRRTPQLLTRTFRSARIAQANGQSDPFQPQSTLPPFTRAFRWTHFTILQIK